MNRLKFWTAALVMVGLAMIGLSALPGPPPGAPWVTDVLMSLGAAVVLFGPFYFLTRTLDSHIEDVRAETAATVAEVREETAASVGKLTDRVTQFQEDVDRRLDDVAANVSARLAAESAADSAAYDSLRVAPSREAIERALARAAAQGLTSPRYPPRVDVSQSQHLYVSVHYAAKVDPWGNSAEPVTFRLETIEGRGLEWIPWREDLTTEDLMVEVGRTVRRESGETLNVAAFFTGLADLLDAANTKPERRPAIQLCPPQWMVTTRGVIRYDGQSVYEISHEGLKSQTIAAHIAEKTWSDPDSFDEAHMAALALFPPDDDEPPF